MTDSYLTKHTRKNIDRIYAWYEVEKDRVLSEMDAERYRRIVCIQNGCLHDFGQWKQIDQEMVAGWVTRYERQCPHCDEAETQKDKPEVDYAIKVREIPNPF